MTDCAVKRIELRLKLGDDPEVFVRSVQSVQTSNEKIKICISFFPSLPVVQIGPLDREGCEQYS